MLHSQKTSKQQQHLLTKKLETKLSNVSSFKIHVKKQVASQSYRTRTRRLLSRPDGIAEHTGFGLRAVSKRIPNHVKTTVIS